jgi:AcrR family transcriptional regulator
LLDDRLGNLPAIVKADNLGPWQTDNEASQHDGSGAPLTEAETRNAETRNAETRNRERIARRQVDKFAERRDELADAALQTLAERGYANTSLRDIAQHSAFSHGVLHYYFADKFELISYCVRRYKAECVQRYDTAVATAVTAEELLTQVGAAMAGTLRADATLHRLWYDLRNQALFEESFRPDSAEIDLSLEAMIWRIVSRYADLAGAGLTVTPALAYALMDGLFQHALLRYLAGDATAPEELDASVRRLLASFLA